MSSKFSFSSILGGDHVTKAEDYEKKGQPQKAAEHYLKAKRPERAAQLWAACGEIDRAVKVYRQAGLDGAAGELLLARGRGREALALFESAGLLRQAAEVAVELKQLVRAGRLFEAAGLYRRAHECFTQAGEIEHALGALELESKRLKQQAAENPDGELEGEVGVIDLLRAELLVKLGLSGEAGRLLAGLGLWERAAELLEADRRFVEAAAAHLDAGHPEAALAALGKARGVDEEVFRRTHRRAAELFSARRLHAQAGSSFAEAGEHRRAGEAFGLARRHREAADAYLAAGERVAAGEHYLDAGEVEAARQILEEVLPGSAEIVPASLLLVSALLKSGDPEAAQERLRVLEEQVEAGQIPTEERYYWQGRINEELANYSQAEDCYEKVIATHSDFRDTTERLREIRGKIPAIDTSSWTFAGAEDGAGDDPHRTGPIALPPEAPSPPEADETSPTLTFAALPYAIEQRLDPWWPGVQVVRALELGPRRPALLVSLPQAGREAWIDSFRRIARDLIALAAPAILKLDDVILTEERIFLRYESFSGEPIELLLRRERLPPLKAVHVLAQVAEALSTAHKLGIPHRWLSPRTILVDARGRTKVVGFGLREMLTELDPTTDAYLSPEARAGLTVGPPADVYGAGLLGRELLEAMVPAHLLEAETLDPAVVTWPAEVEEAVPQGVRECLLRALARNPAKRPSAEELRLRLSSLGMIPGQVIEDRYEILGELGRGGMSRVYRARDRLLDTEVAIKTLLTPVGSHGEDKSRLLREAQISLRITHPNVVRVYDARELTNGIFLIMELLDGLGLDEIIRFEAPLALPRAKRLLAEITAALIEAHGLNVVHRDLKPGNIIVLASGRTKVMDFGIARSYDTASQLTRAGEVIGSPLYMAPEQIQGLPLDGTCDLYALGVIAFATLTGREPFLGENANAVVLQHLNDPPPNILHFNPELPPAWVAMIEKLLAKKPRDRYPSAEQLAQTIAGLPE